MYGLKVPYNKKICIYNQSKLYESIDLNDTKSDTKSNEWELLNRKVVSDLDLSIKVITHLRTFVGHSCSLGAEVAGGTQSFLDGV